jgi:predicted transcriptional regulator
VQKRKKYFQSFSFPAAGHLAILAPLAEALGRLGPPGSKTIDGIGRIRDSARVATPNVKSDLIDIANRLPASASYADAMYEIYVRMKIARGRQAADEGRVVPHAEVKSRFTK